MNLPWNADSQYEEAARAARRLSSWLPARKRGAGKLAEPAVDAFVYALWDG